MKKTTCLESKGFLTGGFFVSGKRLIVRLLRTDDFLVKTTKNKKENLLQNTTQ